jgi:Xaa-Pro aminopeptidase
MPEDLRKQNVRQPISTKELERRWKALRKAMEKADIDCLITQNSNQFLGGNVRYLTDIPAENAYHRTVIFPLNDGMTLISHGGDPLPPAPPDWAAYGAKECISLPFIPTLNWSHRMDAEAAVKTLKKLKVKSIGYVNKGMIAATLTEYIADQLPKVAVHDATDLFDEIKAVKSAEELSLIRKTIEMQDIMWGATLALVRPGVREYEIRSEIKHLLTNMGSEEQLIMMGSAPAGSPAGHKPSFFQNRTLQYGDQIMIMIEVNGLGGYYGEIGRTICLGEAPKAMLQAWADALELQEETAALMKPGAVPAELFDANNRLLKAKGYMAEGRLFAHGQGYDLVERPGIRPEEKMTLKAGMVLAIHPITLNKRAYAFCCDNFLITEKGAELMHKTPRKVFVI